MRYRTVRKTDAEVIAFIRDYLGSQREAITYLVENIRAAGITFPTSHSRAMDEFERLGFHLEKEYTKPYNSLVRTYVRSIPS